jgi:hypothetical protein
MPSELIVVEALPEYESAWIPAPKLNDYVLNPESAAGASKAVVFSSVFAIEREHSGYLYDQILTGLPESPAILHEETDYGATWEVPILVTGRNGRAGYVQTGWISRPEDRGPQFVTARVAKPRDFPRLRSVREAFGYAVV